MLTALAIFIAVCFPIVGRVMLLVWLICLLNGAA